VRHVRPVLDALVAAFLALGAALVFERGVVRLFGLDLGQVNAGRPSALVVAGARYRTLGPPAPPRASCPTCGTMRARKGLETERRSCS
jgi:hypothetical protein